MDETSEKEVISVYGAYMCRVEDKGGEGEGKYEVAKIYILNI